MSNSNQTCIENVQLLSPGKGITPGSICFADGRISSVADQQPSAGNVGETIDGGGGLLTPGLIDVHTHGIEKFIYEASPEDLLAGAACLARYGTTSVCPTLYTVMKRPALPQLEALAAAIPQITDVHIPGLHLEGPFFALPGAGASTIDGDVGFLDELIAATQNQVAVMSLSPDTPKIIPVIERLVEVGAVPFMTHTSADVDQTQAAIDAGARHATHFYDVFYPPAETDGGVRPVGAVEVILADRRCTVDFIADGVHVHPAAIRAAVAAKGTAGVVLITDSNIGAGLAEGIYETPWGFPVQVAPGKGARNALRGDPRFGGLAGSALTMPEGIGNLVAWLDEPKADAWATGTLNPAAMLGLESKGRLLPGCDADLVLWDDTQSSPRPLATWLQGRLVWSDPAANITSS